MHHAHIPADFLKAALGGGFAIASWFAGQLAQAVEEIPQWVKSADTPLVIVGLAYGVIHLWRELKKANDARIADRDAFVKKLQEDSDRSQQSRERLIIATEQQTSEFKALRRSVENRQHAYDSLLQRDHRDHRDTP